MSTEKLKQIYDSFKQVNLGEDSDCKDITLGMDMTKDETKICVSIVLDEKIETFYRLCGERKEFWSSDESSYIKELLSMQQNIETL